VEPTTLNAAVYRWVAQTRLGQTAEAKQELRETVGKSPNVKTGGWSTKVAAFILGDIDQKALLAAAQNEEAQATADQLCEGWFIAGQVQLAAGNNAEAENCFRQSVAAGKKSFGEYALAEAELARLAAKK
jgi:lipoprotein NlpI